MGLCFSCSCWYLKCFICYFVTYFLLPGENGNGYVVPVRKLIWLPGANRDQLKILGYFIHDNAGIDCIRWSCPLEYIPLRSDIFHKLKPPLASRMQDNISTTAANFMSCLCLLWRAVLCRSQQICKVAWHISQKHFAVSKRCYLQNGIEF